MGILLQDLRHALRGWVRRPALAALAVTVVALGVGAATAMFSVLDTLLLRALPYEGAERIVTIWEENAESGIERDDVAPGNFLDWREQADSFEAIAALDPRSLDLTGTERPEVLFSARVTEGFFQALGTRALHGRTFVPDDFRAGGNKVVVLSHSLWQRRFGADPDLVGQALPLDGEPYMVIGILPRSFEPHLLPTVGDREAWIPYVFGDWEEHERGSRWWNVVARLRPGVSLAAARAEMDAISTRLAADFPKTNGRIRANLVPLREHLAGGARTALLVLQGAVGLLFAIACANLAGLFLARGTERHGEFAMRATLGAGRWRLVRQLLVESGVIAVVGGALGVAVAHWAVGLITALAPADLPRLDEVRVDGRVLLFTLGLSGVTALIAGIVPSFRLSRPDLQVSLKQGRTGAAGDAARGLRGAMVVVEIALCVVLMTGAGLLARSFVQLLGVDPGFDRENLAVVQVFRYVDGETPEELREFIRQTVARIDALPGVGSAAAVSAMPFIEANIDIQQPFLTAGRPQPREHEAPNAFVAMATPEYFRTMGIPLLAGRGIEPTDDAGAPPVAVVTEALRRRHWPGESPVGQRIRFLDGDSDRQADDTSWVEIVGVVGQVRHDGLDHEPRPEVFLPHAQSRMGSMTFVARAEGDAAALLDPMQEAVWALDPLQTVYRAATLRELVAKSVAARRFNLWLLGAFAAIALTLAAIGIYGVVSYSTRSRRHEFGVRMALGAEARDVLREAMLWGARMTGLGLALGLVGALGLTRALRSLLFGVSALDPLTFAGVALLLLAVALAAVWLPARRATRLDPTLALRAE